ncbi:hypothetical protein OAA53_02645 [Salibacteraceae bacterium]|jgi:hypothetical protein|nr:hypothetical protein [Salibacteraceae bacterium]
MRFHFRSVLTATLACFCLHAISQSPNEELEQAPYFASLSVGFGMMYGGLGANFEAGAKHVSGYAAFGYAPAAKAGTVTIKESFNYQLGVRYSFNVGSQYIFPRIGLGFGWITNYYDHRIMSAPYDQTVDGLSLHTGVQVYSGEGFIFSFDLGMGSKIAITNANSHPHFYSFYIRPCVGVGYDIARLFYKRDNSTIKNKEINPFE